MNTEFDPTELSDLLVRVQTGGASDAQQQRLIELLTASREARCYYVDQVIVSVLLAESADNVFGRLGDDVVSAGGPDANGASVHDAMILRAVREGSESAAEESADSPLTLPPATAPAESKLKHIWQRRRWLGAAAVLLVAVSLAVVLLKPGHGRVTVIGAIDAKWGTPNVSIDAGTVLPGSELELTAGLVQIQFPSGARAVVQAPARFRAEPPNRMVVLAGKVSAQVPKQARGFTIATKSASVVDLGTEFGVDATEDGGTDVTVFQGNVTVAPKGVAPSAALVLSAGSATKVNSGGTTSPHAVVASAFVLPRDFDSATGSGGSDAFKRRRAYSERARAAEEPTKDLLSLKNDFQKRAKLTEQVSAVPSQDPAKPGLVVTVQPGTASAPGISLKPAGGANAWDLSAFGHVEATVVNTGSEPVRFVLRVDNAGDWKKAPHSIGQIDLKPGQRGTVTVVFGYQFAQKGYPLDPKRIVNILMYTGRTDAVTTFRIESLVAGGPAGETRDTKKR